MDLGERTYFQPNPNNTKIIQFKGREKMADSNSLQIIILLSVIAAILISGSSTLIIIVGAISIVGLAFFFATANEPIYESAPNKSTITTMNSREVKSNGEIIVHEEKTETNSITAGM